MFFYSAYQLTIQSDFSLSGFSPVSNPITTPDVVIVRYPPEQPSPPEMPNVTGFHILATNSMAIVRPPVQFCLIEHGKHVVLQPMQDAPDDVIAHFIQVEVMLFLLHQRGFFLLHASAIEMNGGAIIFLASSTGGKSTMAAFMGGQGYPIISDDIVCVDIRDEEILVIPADSHLRLWPDAAAFVGGDVEQLTKVIHTSEKRILEVVPRGSASALPFKAAYVLAYGESLEIEAYRFQEAFEAIMAHTNFGLLYTRDLRTYRAEAAKVLNDCVKVTGSITVARLQRPKSLEMLPQVMRLILAHG